MGQRKSQGGVMITIKELAQEIKRYAGKTYSQTDQDIMVLILTKFKKEGATFHMGSRI